MIELRITELRINAEIFTRLLRLFTGVKNYSWSLLVVNTFYTLSAIQNDKTIASFSISEPQLEFEGCVVIELTAEFIKNFSSLPLKNLSPDIIFIVSEDKSSITVTYAEEVYDEILPISSTTCPFPSIPYDDDLILQANLFQSIKEVTASDPSTLYITVNGLTGFNKDTTLVTSYKPPTELTLNGVTSIQIESVVSWKNFFNKINTNTVGYLAFYKDGTVCFTSLLKLGDKSLIPVITTYAGLSLDNFLLEPQLAEILDELHTDDFKYVEVADITPEKIQRKLLYIHNKALKPEDLTLLTEDGLKMEKKMFVNLFNKLIDDIYEVKIHRDRHLIYIKTSVLEYIASLYFEVKSV